VERADITPATHVGTDAGGRSEPESVRRTPLSQPPTDRVRSLADRVLMLNRRRSVVGVAKFNSGI